MRRYSYHEAIMPPARPCPVCHEYGNEVTRMGEIIRRYICSYANHQYIVTQAGNAVVDDGKHTLLWTDGKHSIAGTPEGTLRYVALEELLRTLEDPGYFRRPSPVKYGTSVIHWDDARNKTVTPLRRMGAAVPVRWWDDPDKPMLLEVVAGFHAPRLTWYVLAP